MECIKKINMQYDKVRSLPLGSHFKLRKKQSSEMDVEKEKTMSIPYASAADSLIYLMVCIRPNITMNS